MARIRRGVEQVSKDYNERKTGGGGGDFIPYLSLRDDGDTALIRFVTEYEAEAAQNVGTPHVIVNGDFHNVEMKSKNNKTFYKDILCDMEYDFDTDQFVGDCQYCADDNRRKSRFLTWAYVKCYYHNYQNPDATNPWPQVKLGSRRTVFKEAVEKFMVFSDGFYMWQKLEGKIDMYGTLTDRDYLVIRHGARRSGKVTKDLEGLKESELDADLITQAQDLPDLEKIALGEIEKMSGEATDTSVTESLPTEEIDLDDGSEASDALPDDLPW